MGWARQCRGVLATATVALDLSNPLVVTGAWFVGLASLLALVNFASNIWRNARSNPPMTSEVAILKTQVASLEQRITDAKKSASDAESRQQKDLAKIEAELKEDRIENEKRFTALFGKMDVFQGTLQNLSNELFKSVGRLEGASMKMEQDAIKHAVHEAVHGHATTH